MVEPPVVIHPESPARVRPDVKRSALAASGVLAIIVLIVFYVYQDYGPQSAVRRFYNALETHDQVELQKVLDKPLDSPDVQRLLFFVVNELNNGSVEMRRMDRYPKEVHLAVVYTMSDGRRGVVVWVVDKNGRVWQINVRKTLDLLEQ